MNSMSDFSSWQGREVILKPIEWLKPHPDNPRMITDANISQLAKIIEEMGFLDPVEARENGEILAGHRRLLAAKQLKLTLIPTIIHGGLSDQEAAAYRIASNQAAEHVKWNRSMLADQVASLSESFAPDVMGFDDKEVAKLFDLDLGFQDDQQPEKTESADTQPGPFVRQGETWNIGPVQLTVWGDHPDSLRKVEELIGKMQKWMKVKATLGDEDGPTFEATIAERAMGEMQL